MSGRGAVTLRPVDELTSGCATWTRLDPGLAYGILRLRCDVFVVEQACPYPDIDGRDLEPTTEHRWLAPTGRPQEVAAYLRVLADPAGLRIGRVVTAPAARGRGLAGRLLREVVQEHGGQVLVLDAQTYATAVYARHGFTVAGPEFLEDGIPHVPMRRDPRPDSGATARGEADDTDAVSARTAAGA